MVMGIPETVLDESVVLKQTNAQSYKLSVRP
jgi:hypothetical protein